MGGVVVEQIAQSAIEIARHVASILREAESLVGAQKRAVAESSLNSEEEGLEEHTFRVVSEAAKKCRALHWADPSYDERLPRLVAQAWTSQVCPPSAKRPDVLALTCQLLANSKVPHAYDVARFCIVLLLRSLYGVPYSSDSLRDLHIEYQALQRRFIEQKRRRQRKKKASRFENLLIDVLCLDQWVYRSLTPLKNVEAYYNGFAQYPLGIRKRSRVFAESDTDWPELNGVVPEFGSVLTLLFAQPTAIRGLDDVLGGLMPPVTNRGEAWSGGLVTLVGGPPGAGKTSLCLSVTSRMAQMGSEVRYIASEEENDSLLAKRTALAESTTASLWPKLSTAEPISDKTFEIVPASDFTSLTALVSQLERDIEVSADTRTPQPTTPGSIYLTFPRVIVLDSLTALFEGKDPPSETNGLSARQLLAGTLHTFRRLGVCVFLVGGIDDCKDHGLAYLVDNIFMLDILNLEGGQARNLPLRVFSVRKTRFQTSDRGQHTFHLSRSRGCAVSPSLHSVLRSLKNRDFLLSDPTRKAVIWAYNPKQGRLPSSRSIELIRSPVLIRNRSQCLAYGRGSAAKAKFGLMLAFEPRVPVEPQTAFEEYVASYSNRNRELQYAERIYIDRVRVLVISFLYNAEYYQDLAADVIQKRFHFNRHKAGFKVKAQVGILDFYPGSIDAETIVGLVRQRIREARLEGMPYTAVLIDGVHNVLLQFPLLEHEPLLWSTLSRLFRIEGLDAITTFTFFQAERFLSHPLRHNGEQHLERENDSASNIGGDSSEKWYSGDPRLTGPERLFFHLLVSSCDHTFLIERPDHIPQNANRNCVRVRLTNTVDGFRNEPAEFWWDPTTFRSLETTARETKAHEE